MLVLFPVVQQRQRPAPHQRVAVPDFQARLGAPVRLPPAAPAEDDGQHGLRPAHQPLQTAVAEYLEEGVLAAVRLLQVRLEKERK